jgi:hypothetical protein
VLGSCRSDLALIVGLLLDQWGGSVCGSLSIGLGYGALSSHFCMVSCDSVANLKMS